MDFSQGSLFTDYNQTEAVVTPIRSTSAIVKALKAKNEDYEYYPSQDGQIQTIINDIKRISVHFDLTARYSDSVQFLDIGAGDGRVLEKVKAAFEQDVDNRISIATYAIEKATIHINSYREKGITLLGTEFNETNFISKNCEIGFTNPPYSTYNTWISTLISQLNFSVLYAIIPERWEADPMIKDAIKRRGVKSSEILDTSDFYDADRKARAKVHIVRFAFNRFKLDEKPEHRRYRKTLGHGDNTTFQMFIENELGLHKTYSDTTEKFNAHVEKEHVRQSLKTEGTKSYDIVVSKGVLWALLDNYEHRLQQVLEQYKSISTLDPVLLSELGVNYDNLRAGIKDKLFGYRNVFWELLFEHLDAISSRLISKHKTDLLNELKANALDFTYTNSIFIIQYAVSLANEKIELSLVDVFRDLTSADSIKSYYVSNQHIYRDDWRYNRESEARKKAKYQLDYRFIYSTYSNFSTNSWEHGLNESARGFTNDLKVIYKLLGYSDIYTDKAYDDMAPGNSLSIIGSGLDGKPITLVTIRYYHKGTRHIKWNQDAMLRFNVTVSRILGWVRSKEDFAQENEDTKTVNDNVWQVGDNLKIIPSSILALTDKTAA